VKSSARAADPATVTVTGPVAVPRRRHSVILVSPSLLTVAGAPLKLTFLVALGCAGPKLPAMIPDAPPYPTEGPSLVTVGDAFNGEGVHLLVTLNLLTVTGAVTALEGNPWW